MRNYLLLILLICSNYLTFGQSPITEFEENIIYTNCNYVMADFYYVSSNTADADSVCWDFGDGVVWRNSYTNSASHTYSTPGTYTVTLTIWLNRIKTQIVKPDLVKVYKAPIALFDYTVSNNNLIAPLQVEFNNQSILGDGDLVEYEWRIDPFSEEPLSNDKNFSYLFKEPGTYYVQLNLKDNNDCQVGYSDYIIVKDPIQINEFDYITGICNEVNSCPAGINYKIENNTLTLFGQISKNCCGYKTAVIIDKGDSIQIPTFEGGPECTCSCLFCFEINIPNFNRESCVVEFDNHFINVNSNNNSISDLRKDENIRITPNPFKKLLVVELNDMLVSNCKIEIFTLLGQLVHKQIILNNTTNIDMSKYNKGIYLLKFFKDDKIVKTEKLIKE